VVKNFFIVIGLAFFCLNQAYGQQSQNKATAVNYTVQKDLMVINYNLPAEENDVFYTIQIKVIDSVSHSIANPAHTDGDIGNTVKGGDHKQVKWYFT